MKRKFKLFATIASLCMAVALMAFGVYAASTVAYNLNGSVTYDVKDVYVTISTQVHYLEDSEVGYANETAVTSASGTWAQVTQGVPAEFNNGDQPGAANEGGKTDYLPAFDFNTSTLYRVSVTVTSRNQDKSIVVTPSITANGVPTESEGEPGTAATNVTLVNATENTTIVAKGTQAYTFYVALNDAKLLSTGTFQIVLSIAQG